LQRQLPSAFYAYDRYVEEPETMLQRSYAMACKNVETSKVDNKHQYGRYVHVPECAIGEQVLMRDEGVRRGRSKELEAPYVGTYESVGTAEPNLQGRTKLSKVLKIHANRAKLCFV
jgi:hypothetical protein